MQVTTWARLVLFGASASLLVSASACSDDGGGEGGESSETSSNGDGDGDASSGDGDGDAGSGDGDGDASSGDGDGDAGSGDGDAGSGDGDGDEPQPCVYPDAAEPMALNQPLAAYAWPEAIRNNFTSTPLDLEDAFCNTDEEIDWSPHDILVFISIPAW